MVSLLCVDLLFLKKLWNRHYNKHGIRVNNALQTNGYLLDDAWCKFFKENQFLIGLSIDGTKQLHDMYRHDKNGNPTFDRIKSAADLMDQYGVDYNILTGVTQNAAYHATEHKKRPVTQRKFIIIIRNRDGNINSILHVWIRWGKLGGKVHLP